ncbi:MAG: hypothetical protein F6K28_41315 [Microcoleus sp. SIO2G3]|nr:hypothetical protein [Microcoleus sp. SIO2G3]
MSQLGLSPHELSIILAALEYWVNNHDDDDPDDQMDEDMAQDTFGAAGQPDSDEIAQLCRKLYPLGSGVQAIWRS